MRDADDKSTEFKKNELKDESPFDDDANTGGNESAQQKQGLSGSRFGFLKHLLPAVGDAFAIALKTFKGRVKGQSVPAKSNDDEDQLPEEQDRRKTLFDNNEDEKKLPPQSKPGGFKSKLNAVSGFEEDDDSPQAKVQRLLIIFLVVLLVLIPVGGGLYLGGLFDDGGAPPAKADKVVSTAKKEPPKKDIFDSILSFIGLGKPPPSTPREKLEAMNIKYNADNLVKYAGENDMEVVDLFIKTGMPANLSRITDEFTPLMAAASYNRLEMAGFLLNQGANINAQDFEGQTALMKAVKHNRPEMVELLLEKKADYNIADIRGNTAMSIANERYGDNHLTRVFSRFGIDVSSAKKMPAPNLDLTLTLPENKQYYEISVYDYLKTDKSPNHDNVTKEE